MKKLNSRRKFHRISFDGTASLQFCDDKFDCLEVENLSLGGMCVKGQVNKTGEKECEIQLFHKDKAGNNSLRALAEVVWSNAAETGLKFINMNFENYMLLMTTLINNAKLPSIILYQFPKNTPFVISINRLKIH